jgi:hypothetical protein
LTTGNLIANTQSTTTATSSAFLELVGARQQVGAGTSGNLQYIDSGSTLQFVAPAGKYFDSQHVLQTGTVSNVGDTTSFYAAVTSVIKDTTSANTRLVNFGTVVPTGAILANTYPVIVAPYKNTLTSSLISSIITQINAEVNFGLTFDQINQTWINIPPSSIQSNNTWLLKFTYNQGTYAVSSRTLQYVFASVKETSFYFDPTVRVYDSTTGVTVPDTIKILKINSQPGSNTPIGTDMLWQIYNTINDAAGYANTGKVLVKSPTTQVENVPDNPDLYTTVAATSTSRSGLYFQWQHNSPSRNRIDPTPVNLMDVYILTADYTTSYMEWLQDLTGTVSEPTLPTSSGLEIAYSTLDNYKAVSDTLIYNPAQFKPLFGAKADPSLRARFQVVINPTSSITANEMKSQIIAAINKYFNVSNWDFGDTFYFSELAAYLHTTLAPNLASILITPANTGLVFGNYFQINSQPWEIITSAATINDIDIVSAVTAAQLNLGNPLVGTY